MVFLLENGVNLYLWDIFDSIFLDNVRCYYLENIVSMLEEYFKVKEFDDFFVYWLKIVMMSMMKCCL